VISSRAVSSSVPFDNYDFLIIYNSFMVSQVCIQYCHLSDCIGWNSPDRFILRRMLLIMTTSALIGRLGKTHRSMATRIQCERLSSCEMRWSSLEQDVKPWASRMQTGYRWVHSLLILNLVFMSSPWPRVYRGKCIHARFNTNLIYGFTLEACAVTWLGWLSWTGLSEGPSVNSLHISKSAHKYLVALY
jgi:hypothetical protein